ncbi:MAG: DUF6249 domain-containing protein [Wenyingzhuangia sp.]|jgi:hypothetical protein
MEKIMNGFMDSLNGALALGIGYVSVLLPVLIVLIIFFYDSKNKKSRYDTLITISKNINNPDDLKEILESLVERKSPTDYRRNGVITIGVGIGLFLLGKFGLGVGAIFGVGLLVSAIGIGLMIAGYLYPIESEEINKAVEQFEKK